jgi:hypothetical protein
MSAFQTRSQHCYAPHPHALAYLLLHVVPIGRSLLGCFHSAATAAIPYSRPPINPLLPSLHRCGHRC